MIKVGQQVKFNPHAGMHTAGDITPFENTIGTVKYVNSQNRWFSVEYGDPKLRVSFNFHDLGKSVRVC
jgi:hypothetical protein